MDRTYPIIDVVMTGQNIKRIMQARGFSVREVQRFLGLVTPQSIYHWFEGRNTPTIDNLYALSELFCVPIDELLCGNRKYTFAFNSDNRRRLYAYYVGVLGLIA